MKSKKKQILKVTALYVIWNPKSVKCPASIAENPVPLCKNQTWRLCFWQDSSEANVACHILSGKLDFFYSTSHPLLHFKGTEICYNPTKRVSKLIVSFSCHSGFKNHSKILNAACLFVKIQTWNDFYALICHKKETFKHGSSLVWIWIFSWLKPHNLKPRYCMVGMF